MFATSTPGREQPSGPSSGQDWRKSGGLLTPALSVTPAKCVSCAAQSAALSDAILRCKSSALRALPVEAIVRLVRPTFRRATT